MVCENPALWECASSDVCGLCRRSWVLSLDCTSTVPAGRSCSSRQHTTQETQAEGASESHYTLFDAGPESKSIARNVRALNVPVARVSRVVLSHWHADHSGGLLEFLRHRASTHPDAAPCVADLHPDRPIARGIAPVSAGGKVVGRLPADPTFAQVEACGGVVDKRKDGHAVAEGAVWVSGEVPRVTDFEQGVQGGVRYFEEGEVGWQPEPVSICRSWR